MTSAWHPAQLLAARDAAARLHPVDRALVLLRLAGAADDPAALPIAARDRALFDVHRANFGEAVACLADCPACGAVLEFDLSARLLAEQSSPPPAMEALEIDGWQFTLRPLDSHDLAAAARAASLDQAVALLARRGVADCRSPAGEAAPLPDHLAQAVAERVNQREDADISVALECAECGHGWTAPVEPGAHLWAEVDRRANRLIADVATLAARFGWSETEILALPPARRAAYLAMAGAA